MNEAVTASDSFEDLASQLERAGYEVLISLDVSAYAQVHASSAAPDRLLPASLSKSSDEPATIELSSYDLSFLKELKIKADENLQY